MVTERVPRTHPYEASPGSRSGACRRCGLGPDQAIHQTPAPASPAPRRLALRVLHGTTVCGAPRPDERCAGSGHESPFPLATTAVVLVLEGEPPSRLNCTAQLALCAACLAALPTP